MLDGSSFFKNLLPEKQLPPACSRPSEWPPTDDSHAHLVIWCAGDPPMGAIPQNECTKFQPFGVPRPVAGSQPGPVASVES